MLPLLGGLITGGAGLLGSIFSSETSAQNTQANIQAQQGMQQQTEAFNAQQAEINREFQTQQSSTAYQRASQDMQKAGLNPAMMFGSGGAASSPSGATASVSSPNMALHNAPSPLGNLGETVGKAVSTAVDMKTMDKMTEEIARTRAEERLTQARIRSEAQVPEKIAAEASVQQAEERLRKARLPGELFSAQEARDKLDISEGVRRPLVKGAYEAQKVSDIAAPLVSSASKVAGLEILSKAFRGGKNPKAWSRGFDAGRMRSNEE